MKSFVAISALFGIACATHGISYGGHHSFSSGHGYPARSSSYFKSGVHGGQYADHGDLVGLHSFGHGHGHGFGFGHGVELSSPISYGYGGGHDDGPIRSKLYGGYVGGFGGYSKGLHGFEGHGGHGLKGLDYGYSKQSFVKVEAPSYKHANHISHGSFDLSGIGHHVGHGQSLGGHELSGHSFAGHELSGHELSGHGLSGHGHSGHGHSVHGHSGHGLSGHGLSGHSVSLSHGSGHALGGYHYGGEYKKSKKAAAA